MKIGDKIVPYAGNYSRQNRGRIFSLPEYGSDAEEYGNIRGFYKCQAMLYGTTTMLEGYSNGLAVDLPKADKQYPKKDYIAKSEVENYIIALPQCALTAAVSEDHLAYLQGLGISCIFAGKEKLDCGMLLEKLYKNFSITRLMIAGGGCLWLRYIPKE